MGIRISQRISYNLGRIAGYALLGAIAGVFGKAINLAGLQQWFSISLGIGLLLIVLFWGSKSLYNPSIQPTPKNSKPS